MRLRPRPCTLTALWGLPHMTPSAERTSKQIENLKPLRRLFARARRRAWLLLGLQSAVFASLASLGCAAVLLTFRSALRLSEAALFGAIALLALAITLFLTLRRRKLLPGYVNRLDEQFDAAGRIVSAAEFLNSLDSTNAFQSMALADTSAWIARRPAIRLPWVWPTRWATLGVAIAILATSGCQQPQQKVAQSDPPKPTGKIKVEQPDSGDHLSPRQPPNPPDSTAGSSMFGQPAERPAGVTYGTQQLRADSGSASNGRSGSSSGSANQGASSPNQQNSSSTGGAIVPARSKSSGAGSQLRSAGRNPGNQNTPPGQPAPNAPPGGSMAGRGPGQKLSDPRGVKAAQKDIAANARKGEGNGGPGKAGDERKPGVEFAQGGSSATTRPASDANYEGVELDEMAIERLPPEQRERIRQYNANLRRLRLTTQPHGS